MSRQKEYTKSDLSFDDLLKAGLQTPPAPATPPKPKPVAKKRRKRVKKGT